MSRGKREAKDMIVYTCCDPRQCIFCVGCGEDIQRGRPLPQRKVGDAKQASGQ